MSEIVPVILCGGVGSRLWPLSRKSLPKQFAPLVRDKSLFEAAVTRVDNETFSDPVIITSTDHRFLAKKQLMDCGRSGTILLEPSAKNTAPAVFASSYHVLKYTGDALILVMPSDHHITDQDAFTEMVLAGCAAANDGAIVTFGVAADRAETGFGYIELDDLTSGPASAVKKFHEKPDFATAQNMVDAGNYVWNAGIFLFRASVMLAHAKKLEPDMLAMTQKAIDLACKDKNFWHINEGAWAKIQGQAVDYAILEKTDQMACVKFYGGWSDLGDWNAVAGQFQNDVNGNILNGTVNQIDCHNTTLWSLASSTQLVGLGLENVVTVAMDDAILVADASRMQEVRDVVDHLDEANIPQAHQHLRDYRPWGWFESPINMPGYQVKRLHVYPGAALSLQSHQHRSEHWVVVSGTATVVIDQKTFTAEMNESVFIKAKQKHRLSNETQKALTVIEVQTGHYLGEDDIERYDDKYSRS